MHHGIRYAVFVANGGALDVGEDLGALGLTVSAVVTPLLFEADIPVDAVPVAVRAPDGRRVAGLSLRLGS